MPYLEMPRLHDPSHRAVLALALCLLVAACSPGRGWETTQILRQLAAGTAPNGVDRRGLMLPAEPAPIPADLYHPADTDPRAALVLVPGASPRGKNDPAVVAFASTLADAAFAVLVPEIEAMKALSISAADADPIARALDHMAERDPDRPLGLIAVSYAVGPAMIAAHRPALVDAVDVVVGIGGYHDSVETVRFFTTGAFRASAEDPWRTAEPNTYGKWVFLRANARRVDSPLDRVLLGAIADRRIADRRIADPEAGIADLVARLGPEGQAVWALLSNRDPEAVLALIEALPQAIRAEIDALNLARRPALLADGPELLLVHGRDDTIIPFTESLALAAAVNAEQPDRARLYLLDGLDHAALTRVGPGDATVLARVVYRLLEIRDGL